MSSIDGFVKGEENGIGNQKEKGHPGTEGCKTDPAEEVGCGDRGFEKAE